MRFSVSRHRRTQSLPSPARGEENPLSVKSQPSKSDPTARNRSAVRPVRTSRPTRAVDLKSNGPHHPKYFGRSDLSSPWSDLTEKSQPLIPNPTMRVIPEDHPLKLPSKTLPSYLRNTPCVPEYPKPGEPFRMPPSSPPVPSAEIRTTYPPSAFRKRHLSRVPKLKQPTLRKFSERATCPQVPKRTPHPEAS